METGFVLLFVPPNVWRVVQYSGNTVLHEESFGQNDNVLGWIKDQYSLTVAQDAEIQQYLLRKLSTMGPILLPSGRVEPFSGGIQLPMNAASTDASVSTCI